MPGMGGMPNQGQQMPGMPNQGMVNQGMGQAQVQQFRTSPNGGMQWVSNVALNAVANENNIGPDGKPVSAFRLYTKDMLVTLTIIPILLTLAMTGALTKVGFTLAYIIVDGISKFTILM